MQRRYRAILGITSDLVLTYPAHTFIQYVEQALGAQGGGGRPDMAQCGGSDASLMPKAIESLSKALL